MVGAQVGNSVAIEAGDIEAAAMVADFGEQSTIFEAQRQLDIELATAMTDGVGGGLLDAQHDVIDQWLVGAVLAQVVANAIAGAQQMRGLRRDAEAQARWRRLRVHVLL